MAICHFKNLNRNKTFFPRCRIMQETDYDKTFTLLQSWNVNKSHRTRKLFKLACKFSAFIVVFELTVVETLASKLSKFEMKKYIKSIHEYRTQKQLRSLIFFTIVGFFHAGIDNSFDVGDVTVEDTRPSKFTTIGSRKLMPFPIYWQEISTNGNVLGTSSLFFVSQFFIRF